MTVTGPIDLNIMVWVRDSFEFQHFWNETLNRYGEYFSNQTVSILTGGIAFKKTYLLSNEYNQPSRKYFELKSGGSTVDIDKIDYKLLDILTTNARKPVIDLAEELGCSSQTVVYHIKNLIKYGVILAFRVGIDNKKIGLQNSAIDIYLKDHTKKNKIITYLETNPFVEYIMESIGWCDIQFEIMAKNIDQINEIFEDINKKYPDSIRKKNFWISKKYYRLRSLPEL